MKRFLKLFIVLLIITTIGNMIKYGIGIWAKMAFYGAAILFYAVLLYNNIVNDLEIDKKYHNQEIVKAYNRKIAKILFGLGAATLVVAIILYVDSSLIWLPIVFAGLLLIWLCLVYDRQYEKEFWAQIPNEDRPKRYQDNPIAEPEEEKSRWVY